MPPIDPNAKVTITIDGAPYKIIPGTYSLGHIIDQTGISSKTYQLNLVSGRATQPNSITHIASSPISGGEVYTSQHN